MIGESDAVTLKKYDPMVRRIAHQFIAKLPANVELDDLIQEGRIGLLDAKQRYDPEVGVTFGTFVTQRIRGAILDYLREMDLASRGVRRQFREIENARLRVENRKGQKASHSEIAAEMAIPLDKYHEILTIVTGTSIVSLDDNGSDEDSSDTLSERIEDPNNTDPLDLYLEDELKDLIRQGIAYLPERERFVVVSVVEHDLTLREVGQKLGVTESRACYLFGQAAKRIKKYIQHICYGGSIHESRLPIKREPVSKSSSPSESISEKNGKEDQGTTNSINKEFRISHERFSLPYEFSIVSVESLSVALSLANMIQVNHSASQTEHQFNARGAISELTQSRIAFKPRFVLPREFTIVSSSRINLGKINTGMQLGNVLPIFKSCGKHSPEPNHEGIRFELPYQFTIAAIGHVTIPADLAERFVSRDAYQPS